jgi:hypothetical protein
MRIGGRDSDRKIIRDWRALILRVHIKNSFQHARRLPLKPRIPLYYFGSFLVGEFTSRHGA